MRLLLARWILLALMFLLVPVASFAGVQISITVAPPVLPVYEQPPCPEQGWMWAPGYWAWGEDGYYWVPGTWVPAPYAGALWTPPWWGWDNGRYMFHDGYWGNEVGYYGGIDYGYGYMGIGFVGGEWRDGRFAYNTAVMRVNPTVIRDTYRNDSIVRQNTIHDTRHIAYNGGPGGIRHDPTARERAAMSGRHQGPTQVQMQRIQAARADRTSYAKTNGGHPHTLAMARPTEGAAARNGATNRPEGRAGTAAGSRTPATRTETPRSAETRRTPNAESRTPSARTGERAAPARTEPSRTSPSRTSPSRTEPARTEPKATRPSAESRSTPTRPEARSTPERSHSESRPVTPPRQETRPKTESRPAPEARPETRAPRQESRPAPQHEARPAPAPQRESRPTPAPQREARPAPQHESRPAPQRESRPEPAHKPEEKPHL